MVPKVAVGVQASRSRMWLHARHSPSPPSTNLPADCLATVACARTSRQESCACDAHHSSADRSFCRRLVCVRMPLIGIDVPPTHHHPCTMQPTHQPTSQLTPPHPHSRPPARSSSPDPLPLPLPHPTRPTPTPHPQAHFVHRLVHHTDSCPRHELLGCRRGVP